MTIVHLHLMINHAAVFGVLIGVVLIGAAMLRRSAGLRRAGYVALILTALITVLVFLSGQAAESRVEDLPGVAERLIDRHQDAAVVSLIGIELLGLLSLFGVALERRRIMPRVFLRALLVVGVFVSGAVGYTANLGGEIRHPEIRSGAPAAGEPAPRAQRHDDDSEQHSNAVRHAHG